MEDKNKITLSDALRRYAEDGYAPFHMPGHKRNPAFGHLMGIEGLDITEIFGFDNLHDASGILKDVNDAAAKTYGVRESRMLVGGSTAGILAAVRALTRTGDGILIARNCHGSVYNAAELARLEEYYVLPGMLAEGFYASVQPECVDKALSENSDIKLVVVTSPTYEGVISDIKGIAEACHRHGVRLIVDEAHGAHLGFASFEESAREQGADIVINSLHKTLPSLTQTAILHICAQDIDQKLVDEQLAVFETSSPSYPLMASIDGCVRYLQRGEEMKEWAKNIRALRESLLDLKNFELYAGGGAFAYDISKLVFVSRGGMSGSELMRALRQEYKIELEMAGVNYAVAMCGAGDTPQMYSRLKTAMYELDRAASAQKSVLNKTCFENTFPKFSQNENTFEDGMSVEDAFAGRRLWSGEDAQRTEIIPVKAMSAAKARDLPFELVPLREAEGRVAAENIRAYPPGCPIIVKGEIVDKRTVEKLTRLFEFGASVQGGKGRFPQNIAVLA